MVAKSVSSWWTPGQCLTTIIVLLASTALQAGPLEDLAALEGMTGKFQQQITDVEGNLVGASAGHFALRKPELLRWEITHPGNQLLLSDGTTVWQYDRDLETATRHPVTTGAPSPLQLLTESREALEAAFVIAIDGGTLMLEPRDDNPGYRRLSITFDDGLPTRLNVEDQLEQRISIRLEGEGAVPDLEQFRPRLPAGIEWSGPEPPAPVP